MFCLGIICLPQTAFASALKSIMLAWSEVSDFFFLTLTGFVLHLLSNAHGQLPSS